MQTVINNWYGAHKPGSITNGNVRGPPGYKICWQGPFVHHDPSGTWRLGSSFTDVCTAYDALGHAGKVAQHFQSPSRAQSGSLPVCILKHDPLKRPLPECACTVGPRKCCSVITAAEDTWYSFYCQNILTEGFSDFFHPFRSPLHHTSFLLLLFSWIFPFPWLFISLSCSEAGTCNHSLLLLRGVHEQKQEFLPSGIVLRVLDGVFHPLPLLNPLRWGPLH